LHDYLTSIGGEAFMSAEDFKLKVAAGELA